MTRLDPIIAVKDLAASSKWYQKILGLRNKHNSDHFAVLVSDDNEIALCLHPWGTHEHPTMTNPNIAPGNGLILYFRTDNMNAIYENAIEARCAIEEDIHLNPNSLRKEFSIRDPNGYFLTITEFHKYDAEPNN